MSLDTFPGSAIDPILAEIPTWPEWISYEKDAPRLFWLTHWQSRYYCLTMMTGETDQLTPLGLNRYSINYAGLQELIPTNWGYSPFLVHEIFDDVEDMHRWVQRVRSDLEAILLTLIL